MGITTSTNAPIINSPGTLLGRGLDMDPIVFSFPDCVNGPLKANLVCNTTATPLDRAQALISLFTIDELVNNTQNEAPGVPRLGLPQYQWWSEALVRSHIINKFPTLTANYGYTARRGI